MPDNNTDPVANFWQAISDSRALRRRLMTQDEPSLFVDLGLFAFVLILFISSLAALGHFIQITP